MVLGARLWTHGYDFYSPTRPWIGTWYGGEKGNRGSWHTSSHDMKVSLERLMTLLKWPGSDQSAEARTKLKEFGLGKRRTLEAYAKYSGIDTIAGMKLRKQCAKKFVAWVTPEDAYSEYPDRKRIKQERGTKGGGSPG